jgi:anaerobic selenocysteine-containing dehydrogenase
MKTQVKSTCCYCGVGCGLLIETDNEKIVGVRGDPEHPANFGRLCTKGASLHLTARPEYRLQHPAMRLARQAPRQRVGWDVALDHAAGRFAEIIRAHGPDSVAFYISGQLLTEDYYVFNKLAKGLIGTNNVDTNSRLCMSSAVAGYKQTLGADAPPCSYEDLGLADCLLIAGANPAVAHPIVFRRVEDAKAANPALKIIVVDPRRTETAAIADLHLALKSGTDIALYNGLLHVLLAEGLVDRAYIAAHIEEPLLSMPAVDALFGLDDEASAIVYADHRRQINKRAVAPDGKLLGVRLAGETLAQSWLKDVMADDTLDAALIRWAVAPIDKPPTKLPEKSRVVCKCADITEQQINAELAQGGSFAGLQEKLKCGTFCGSCVPELKQMLAGRSPRELAA